MDMLKVYDISDAIEVESLPLCPLCDQPIDELSMPAYGSHSSQDGFITLCLIHEECGDALKEGADDPGK